MKVDLSARGFISRLPLCDPSYGNPGPIDVLMGADEWHKFVEDEFRTAPLSAISTHLGIALFGPVVCSHGEDNSVCVQVARSGLPRVVHEAGDDDFVGASSFESGEIKGTATTPELLAPVPLIPSSPPTRIE